MAHKNLWLSVLQRIKPTIKKAHFLTWFQNTMLLETKEGIALIGVPTAFARDWMCNKYNLKIFQALQEVEPTVTKVEYQILSRLADKGNTEGVDVKNACFSEEEKKIRKVKKIAKGTCKCHSSCA